MSDDPFPGIFTDCAHAGEGDVPAENRPAQMPIYQTAVYEFADLAQVDAIWDGNSPGFIYGRYGLPNHAALENIVAKLEGAESALATASGMASITLALLPFLTAGDEVIVANDSYGGSVSLATHDLPRFGMTSRLIAATNLEALEAAFTSRTKIMLAEAISNPLLNVIDVERLAQICHGKGAMLVIDNTVATPYLLRPLRMGADIVIHSATKFLSGHDDVIAGVVVGGSESIGRVREMAIRTGPSLGPFDAWLTLRGIKTFPLRMERMCSNARGVAEYLEGQTRVRKVHYPGLESHPHHAVVRRTMRGLGGGIVSFELVGDFHSVEEFVTNLKLVKFVPSLGGLTSTITHPAKTSHRALNPAQRAAAGITDTLLRLSVGIEDLPDLIAELDRALQEV